MYMYIYCRVFFSSNNKDDDILGLSGRKSRTKKIKMVMSIFRASQDEKISGRKKKNATVYMTIRTYEHTHIHIHMHTLIHIHTHMHIHVICTCIYIYICVYVYIFIYVCICICTCIYIYVCIYVYIYIYIYVHMHMHMHIQIHVNIHVHIHTHIHIHIHIYRHICISPTNRSRGDFPIGTGFIDRRLVARKLETQIFLARYLSKVGSKYIKDQEATL